MFFSAFRGGRARADRRWPAQPGIKAAARPSSGAVSRWLVRNRRLLAALSFCLATGMTVYELTPGDGAVARVVTAGADLPAGEVLDGSALRISEVPAGMVPAHSFAAAEDVIGERLTAPLRQGEILTDAALLGPGLLIGAPSGTVAVPLRVADPGTVQLIRPGELVDVIISTAAGYEQTTGTETAASGVVVLWTAAQGNGGGFDSLTGAASSWPGQNEADGLVVVAAHPARAEHLAAASTRGKVFLVLVSDG